MNGKCSECGEVFEFDCDGQSCKLSKEMQQHIEEHRNKGETIRWIIC